MINRSFFLFAILLLTHPLTASAQEKKICRLCDPSAPPVRDAKEKPLSTRWIMGGTFAWNISDSGLSPFGGASITFLFTRYFGMEGSFEVALQRSAEDQDGRVLGRSSLSGLLFFGGLQPNQDVTPYMKIGIANQEMVRDDSETGRVEFNTLQVGAGLMFRYGKLNLGVEITALAPGNLVVMDDDLGGASINLRFFIGFNGLPWALFFPLVFA